MLTYIKYIRSIEYDSEVKIYTGKVNGLRNLITFHGKTLDELELSFHNSIDFYLEMCKNDGDQPEKPDYGNDNSILSQETSQLDPIEEQQLADDFLSEEAEWDNY